VTECGKTGSLNKQNGVWRGSSVGTAVNGNTIANLARDGLLIVQKNGRLGSATLTARGERFARTLLAQAAEVIE
jgi:predicted transcriptional regulator